MQESLDPIAKATGQYERSVDLLNSRLEQGQVTAAQYRDEYRRLTYVHPVWGERCAEIISVDTVTGGKRVKFQPPIRGGIKVGDALDFNNPRCRMVRASQATNALNMGLWATASLTMVEDMRPPE